MASLLQLHRSPPNLEVTVGINKHVFLLGRIADEPEFWTNLSGHLECDIVIASVQGSMRSKEVPRVRWRRVRLTGPNATYARHHLAKGMPISVTGRIVDRVETAPNGFRKHSTLILGHRLNVMTNTQKRCRRPKGDA